MTGPHAGDPEVDPVLSTALLPDVAADEVSIRRARKWWWATGIVVVLLTVYVVRTGGESASNKVTLPRDFCRAAARYEKEAERQAVEPAKTAAKKQAYVERQAARVQGIVDTAPRKIVADAETFLAALQRVVDDPAAADDVQPRVKEAVDNVNRFANQGCGIYKREGL